MCPRPLPPRLQGDLAQLWDNTTLDPGQVAGVARSCRIPMQQLYNFSHPLVAGSMRRKDCYVNAGVYLLDLVRYRQVRGGVLLHA